MQQDIVNENRNDYSQIYKFFKKESNTIQKNYLYKQRAKVCESLFDGTAGSVLLAINIYKIYKCYQDPTIFFAYITDQNLPSYIFLGGLSIMASSNFLNSAFEKYIEVQTYKEKNE